MVLTAVEDLPASAKPKTVPVAAEVVEAAATVVAAEVAIAEVVATEVVAVDTAMIEVAVADTAKANLNGSLRGPVSLPDFFRRPGNTEPEHKTINPSKNLLPV
jgi:hypothetical protein